MNVLIVDDHPMMVEYLTGAVQKAFPGVAVRAANGVPGALHAASGGPLDLVLLDLELPGHTGLASLLRFRREFPALRVVVVSSLDDLAMIRGAHAAGAAGYIPKTTKPKLVVDVLRLIVDGGRYFPAEALSSDADRAGRGPQSALTERQREMLALLLKGRTVEQAANELDIALATAKHHAHAVYAAYGVSSRADLIMTAARRGAA